MLNKIVAEKFSNFKQKISTQVQEASRTPKRHDLNRPLHSKLYLKQVAQRTRNEYWSLEEKKKKTCKSKPIKITTDSSIETLKTRKGWRMVFWALKTNKQTSNFSPRILNPVKLPFKIDIGIKVFYDKQKLIYDHQTTTKEDYKRNPTHRRWK
jgi:hypothetical protein